MTEESLKSMLKTISEETVVKIKKMFDMLPPEMDATQALNKVLDENINADYHLRMFRAARMYAIPNLGGEGIRAYVKAVSMPAEKSKALDVKLELENSLDNRMSIAKLDGSAVNVYCAQLDVEAYAERDDASEDDGQEELPLDEDGDMQIDDEDLDGVAE